MVGGYRIGMHFLATALRFLEPRLDDDFVDRLHYLYTSTLILMFAVLVSAKQYVGHPIECFVPAQFTRAMEQYTENYCWVQNTYWIPFQDLIPHRLDDRERRQIGYYQWVPFVLAVAALMFHIPSSVWRMLSSQSGLNAGLVLQLACQEQNVDPLVRNKTIDILARHIDDALMYQREHGARKKNVYIFAVVRVGKFYGAYVSTVYVFIKSLHLCNVVLQFLLLNSFLETAEYPLFGAHVLYDLLLGREWRDSGKFPRVTLCDFEIRVLGNVHRHTVQCVLVVNMLTEKIFIFLWIWLSVLGLLTTMNLLFWLCALASSHCRQNFVAKHLDMESDQIGRFTDRFLRPDGVFLLQMIASHAGNLTCAKVTEALWLMFLRRSGKPVLDEKVESSERGEWESNDESGRKESPPRRESWHEPPLPPPMPQLPIRSHYV
ncbi:Innexin unc-9 [Trichostrongylus colubriformis]|uniref:Innexin n=2 Tax=Trichostrongylidae TaxID=6315 RepID=A0AAN8ERQ4_TRICO